MPPTPVPSSKRLRHFLLQEFSPGKDRDPAPHWTSAEPSKVPDSPIVMPTTKPSAGMPRTRDSDAVMTMIRTPPTQPVRVSPSLQQHSRLLNHSPEQRSKSWVRPPAASFMQRHFSHPQVILRPKVTSSCRAA